MGASRWRVVTRVLQQALLLAAAGAVLGTVLARTGVGLLDRSIRGAATFPLPFWMKMTVDGPVLAFVLSAVAVSVLASGLVPALRSWRADLHGTLCDASRGSSSLRIGRISRLLVLAQVSATTLLLILAAHLALQVRETRAATHSFPADEVLSARVGLFEGVFPEREQRQVFYRDLVRRLRERPGVLAAALGTSLPGTTESMQAVAVQGRDYPERTGIPSARVAYVSPEYFDAFDAPVLEGRPFTGGDDAGAPPVALLNRAFVARFFPDGDPLGRRVQVGGADPAGTWLTVVGVVPDLAMDGALRPQGSPEGVYIPLAQSDVRFVSIAVRTRGDPLAFAPTLRDEVMALQRDTPVYFVQTLRASIDIGLLDTLLVGSLLWALALAAFLLASVGLYGVTSFLASQRTRELGVRVALGAGPIDVLRLVLRGGTGQVLLGLALGLLLSAGCMALMASGGMETTAWSFPVAGTSCAVLGATGLAAILIPAWRATKVDPVEALRAE
jgi:predicted permease